MQSDMGPVQRKLGSKYAETVYRDKQTGRTLTKEDFEEKERLAAEKKRAKYETPEWGGGLRQVHALQQLLSWGKPVFASEVWMDLTELVK